MKKNDVVAMKLWIGWLCELTTLQFYLDLAIHDCCAIDYIIRYI